MATRRTKHQPEPTTETGDAYEPLAGEVVNTDFPPAEMAAATAGTSSPPDQHPADGKGKWEERIQRKSPYDSISYVWKGGYSIRYQEKENPRPRRSMAEIRFGDGSLKDKPLNFDKIKELLLAKGLTFIPEDRAWGMDVTRDTHGDVSDHVKSVLHEVVKLEEAVRGPRAGERAGGQEIPL